MGHKLEPWVIKVAIDDLAKLLPASPRQRHVELKTSALAAPPVASSRRKARRREPQVERVLRALPVLYPNGTDGIPTNVVLDEVADYLQPETERLGLRAPSWDSVDRALRQYRAR